MSWPSAAFSDLLVDVSKGQPKTLNRDFQAVGALPLVDQGQSLIGGFTDDESMACTLEPPVIVFGDHTRAVKYVDFRFGVGADGVKLLRVTPGNHPRFLFWALRALDLPSAGYSRHFKFLKDANLPHPPLEEQRRIAAILDAVEALRTDRLKSMADVDSFISETFVTMFSRKRALPSAEIRQLGRVTTGRTPPSSRPGMFGDEVAFITPGDLESDVPPKRWLTKEGAAASKVVRAGATLVCCIGATLGKVGYATEASAFNQQINAVEWSDSVVDSYGYAALRVLRPQIRARGSSTTLPLLKKSEFERVKIAVPPLSDQYEYSRRVASATAYRSLLVDHLNLLGELFSALLAREMDTRDGNGRDGPG